MDSWNEDEESARDQQYMHLPTWRQRVSRGDFRRPELTPHVCSIADDNRICMVIHRWAVFVCFKTKGGELNAFPPKKKQHESCEMRNGIRNIFEDHLYIYDISPTSSGYLLNISDLSGGISISCGVFSHNFTKEDRDKRASYL